MAGEGGGASTLLRHPSFADPCFIFNVTVELCVHRVLRLGSCFLRPVMQWAVCCGLLYDAAFSPQRLAGNA